MLWKTFSSDMLGMGFHGLVVYFFCNDSSAEEVGVLPFIQEDEGCSILVIMIIILVIRTAHHVDSKKGGWTSQYPS